MMVNIQNGLKGQLNLAQGNALGLKAGKKIVRTMAFFKEILLFRTKWHGFQFRPKEVFRSDYCIPADGFRYTLFPQGVALD
jgi:hypothetical protein